MRRLSSALLIFAACSAAQNVATNDRGAEDVQPTFKSDTHLVVLPVSVSDKNGKLINNLPEHAFKVFENGTEQAIKVFRREDVPISLGIVIDNSGSMRDKRLKVETASMDLVKASNPKDEIFIVNFNDEAFLDVPFTNDIKKLEAGVARIDSRGGTALRDSISMSLDHLKEKGKRDKKALLVITDGADTASAGSLEKLIEKARQSSDVSIYAIGLLNEEERREAKKAKRVLDDITRESGGLAFYPKELAQVDAICAQVAQDIRNQYTIAYSPTVQPLDGSFRQIRVIVNGPGHPTARTRTGYYATPQAKTTASISDVQNSARP